MKKLLPSQNKRSIILQMFILIVLQFYAAAFSVQLKAQNRTIEDLSDAPQDTISRSGLIYPISYTLALKEWKTVTEINNWIRDNFQYDIGRAKKMAENSLDRGKTDTYSADEFYQIKKGICVDLSRFAVETINKIDTLGKATYLMIDFEPITIEGKILRKHWITVYQNEEGYYLLGDSKRPGHIAGPYNKIDDFIVEYQNYRDRKIISWKTLSSYKKTRKKKTYKQRKN